MLKYFPYEDFLIYEMGAGNGTLALNVLDFLAQEYPEVYERTQYRIIEISKSLAEVQRQQVASKHSCVEIVNKSVFDWDRHEPAPCFFLALEVVVSRLMYLLYAVQLNQTQYRITFLMMWCDIDWMT